MTEVVVVCEGRTEAAFVRGTLAATLATRRVLARPRVVRTSRHAAGGGLTRGRVLRFVRNTLRERVDVYVTTFFDLYVLPADFPGRSRSAGLVRPEDRAAVVEADLHGAVLREVECRRDRFLPHVQPYEFESLLFSDPSCFGVVEPTWLRFVEELKRARRSASTPEHINGGRDTHPSARLACLRRPRYKKVRHGAAISARIGIDRIRGECRHFDQWVRRLEALRGLRRGRRRG